MKTRTLLSIEQEIDSDIDAGPDPGDLGFAIPQSLELWLGSGGTGETVGQRQERLAKHLEDLAAKLRAGGDPFTVTIERAKEKRWPI